MRQKGSTCPFPGPAGISLPPPAAVSLPKSPGTPRSGSRAASHRPPTWLTTAPGPDGSLPLPRSCVACAKPERAGALLPCGHGRWVLWPHIFLPQGSVCRTLPYHSHSLADIILSPSYKYHLHADSPGATSHPTSPLSSPRLHRLPSSTFSLGCLIFASKLHTPHTSLVGPCS